MNFIEREKQRIAEEEQKRKEEERKRIAKERENEEKRREIYSRVGPILEKLLTETNKKQQQAIKENFYDKAAEEIGGVNWKWEIDWVGFNPRLWGHFEYAEVYEGESTEESKNKKIFDSDGKIYFYRYNVCMRTIFILTSIDYDKKMLRIKAIAGQHEKRTENGESWDYDIYLQAKYLSEGITLPIDDSDATINKIADILIEIRYTWKVQEIEEKLAVLKKQEEIEKNQEEIANKLQYEKEEKRRRRIEYLKDYGPLYLLYLFFGIVGGIFGTALNSIFKVPMLLSIGIGFLIGILVIYIICRGTQPAILKTDSKKEKLNIWKKLIIIIFSILFFISSVGIPQDVGNAVLSIISILIIWGTIKNARWAFPLLGTFILLSVIGIIYLATQDFDWQFFVIISSIILLIFVISLKAFKKI